MRLSDWQPHLPEEQTVYALIDPLAENQPLHYWYRHADDTQARPLYAGTEFADDVLHGPWLLPLAQLPGWQNWWQAQEQANYATGILIASEHPPEMLVQHWQSLLLAGLDGEEVLFRYYDPRSLGPMLYTFTEEETRRFLGPTNELLLWHHDDWLMAVPYPEPDLTEHTESWWRMKEAHFVGQPGAKETFLTNIEGWLWQNTGELTTRIYEAQGDIKAALEIHYAELVTQPVSELWQPSWLILRLAGYSDWWPAIQNAIALTPEAEQTDVMHKTIALIAKHEHDKVREENGQ